MTTNKEWLYSLTPAELSAWFGSERVDIVTCGECSHAIDTNTDKSFCGPAVWNTGHFHLHNATDYCSWGERKVVGE